MKARIREAGKTCPLVVWTETGIDEYCRLFSGSSFPLSVVCNVRLYSANEDKGRLKHQTGVSDGLLPYSARLRKNCSKSGTGRPVAPFSLPDFHAVPAMSRCAHG